MLEGFDWQLFAMISYCFGLVLVIVLIILWGRRDIKSRYSRLLEEKETKLARMQLDIEETMEALDTYATELRGEWERLKKKDDETVHRLHKRQIDLEATVSSLKARVTALEIQARASPNIIKAQEAAPPVQEAALPLQEPTAGASPPAQPKSAVRVSKRKSAKAIKPNNKSPTMAADVEERARALLNDGHDDAQIAKELGLSRGEIALMQKSLNKIPEIRQSDERARALEMYDKGASPQEIARKMGLSVSEVVLLITNPNFN